jgi:hypothetical protein
MSLPPLETVKTSRSASSMVTINRSDPLPSHGEPVDPILKRKLLTYPFPRIEDQQIALPEYRRLIKTENRWRDQVEAQELADEIAAFERQHMGKTRPPSQIPIVPLDPVQQQKVQQFKLPTLNKLLDFDQPPAQVFSRSTSVSSKTRFLNSPAVWNSLDEPLIPSRAAVQTDLSVKHSRPFTQLKMGDTRFGIPLCSTDLVKLQKKKFGEYQHRLRYFETCDNQVREEQIKNRMIDERNALMSKHDKTLSLCARLGQAWATSQGTRKSSLKPKNEPAQMSKEDEEAMRYLKKRDDDLMDEHREKKKELRQQGLEGEPGKDPPRSSNVSRPSVP